MLKTEGNGKLDAFSRQAAAETTWQVDPDRGQAKEMNTRMWGLHYTGSIHAYNRKVMYLPILQRSLRAGRVA